MRKQDHYVMRGGVEGRERLRLLSRVMHASTSSLFSRLGLADGMACLDVGCGGGDATFEMCRHVGPGGSVLGVDINETNLNLARREAEELGISNVQFRVADVRTDDIGKAFDVVYARFLLTHLDDPARIVRALYGCLRPGGTAILEDIDFSGYFTYPESTAFRRYHELYCALVRKRGGDPNIGPRLPLLLADAGVPAFSRTHEERTRVEILALKDNLAVALQFEVRGADSMQLRQFARRVLAKL
ncbi:MAG TPA: methyltransferase domain-containing protein [Acidobacteriota bacterium]|jgi:SAM-dependent methyltransferase